MAKKSKKQLPAPARQAYGTELAYNSLRANHKMRSRHLAAVLAFLTGFLGVHNFYLGKVVPGILQLLLTVILALVCLKLFCAPYVMIIPFALAIVRGILLLGMDDAKFREKYRVRTF